MRAEIASLTDWATGADGNGRPSHYEIERISVRTAELEDWLARIITGVFDVSED
jgi:hypothetical protein